jgi:hypothetical protein
MGSATRRKSNLALLVLAPAAVLSGLFSKTIGVDWIVDPAAIHTVASLAILVTAPWKSAVILRDARRRRPARWASYVLLTLIVTTPHPA